MLKIDNHISIVAHADGAPSMSPVANDAEAFVLRACLTDDGLNLVNGGGKMHLRGVALGRAIPVGDGVELLA